MMRYPVMLEADPDGGFVAFVPVLGGCVSQGETREEALANIREAAQFYVETCLADGDSLPVEAGREIIEIDLESFDAPC